MIVKKSIQFHNYLRKHFWNLKRGESKKIIMQFSTKRKSGKSPAALQSHGMKVDFFHLTLYCQYKCRSTKSNSMQ